MLRQSPVVRMVTTKNHDFLDRQQGLRTQPQTAGKMALGSSDRAKLRVQPRCAGQPDAVADGRRHPFAPLRQVSYTSAGIAARYRVPVGAILFPISIYETSWPGLSFQNISINWTWTEANGFQPHHTAMRFFSLITRVNLALTAALVGCSRQPENAPFREEATSRSDLAGIWTIAPQSLSLVARYSLSGTTNIAFELRPDGRILATNVPLYMGANASSLNAASGTGRWEIDNRYAAFEARVSLDGHVQRFDVREFNSKPILTMTLGDPDSGQVIVFKR